MYVALEGQFGYLIADDLAATYQVAGEPIQDPIYKEKSVTKAKSSHQSPGLWVDPEDESWRFNDVDHWIELAQLLESAKFHGIFIADVLGGYDVYKGPRNLAPAEISGAQWPVNEPIAVISAMAAATKSIGFGVTVTTTYEQPYHLARRLSTVDHLTKGRWVFWRRMEKKKKKKKKKKKYHY